jgi:hypothetical protein
VALLAELAAQWRSDCLVLIVSLPHPAAPTAPLSSHAVPQPQRTATRDGAASFTRIGSCADCCYRRPCGRRRARRLPSDRRWPCRVVMAQCARLCHTDDAARHEGRTGVQSKAAGGMVSAKQTVGCERGALLR